MTCESVAAIAACCDATHKLPTLQATTETTYYLDVRALLTAALRAGGLPFDVRKGTPEAKSMPDFVLGDVPSFVAVYGEVKKSDVPFEDLAASTDQTIRSGATLVRPTSLSSPMRAASA